MLEYCSGRILAFPKPYQEVVEWYFLDAPNTVGEGQPAFIHNSCGTVTVNFDLNLPLGSLICPDTLCADTVPWGYGTEGTQFELSRRLSKGFWSCFGQTGHTSCHDELKEEDSGEYG